MLQGDDPLKSKREAFYKEVLLPPNGCTVAENIVNEADYKNAKSFDQIDIFGDYSKKDKQIESEETEKSLQKAVINIKSKYGKNAILKGMNFEKAGTTIERNEQIGGHKS